MPDLYCKACKRTTLHKSVMRRCELEADTLPGRMQQWAAKFFSGECYYEMERQHFCRTCNCRSESPSAVPQTQIGLA
ncbi:hypothetical protein [Vibrio sp. 99-70-13A1]|uniref:hypothetical protein n=1 Tax=Vibrio sp. 99-70-13A1 TaxID=2607601 RepID=UPI0014933FA4|nr:hypothetical protein [Vibrio sp. 99-70-13A1]NOH95894.1 hypothetical protein [Vibrio sp. 99-70-13A1]